MRIEKIFIQGLILCAGMLLGQDPVSASEIYLVNGDRVSGEIIEISQREILIDAEMFGTVSIRRDFVRELVTEKKIEEPKKEEESKKGVEWIRDVSMGFNQTSGNTKTRELASSIFVNRKSLRDEYTLKAEGFYSSQNRKMNARRYSGMVRYAFSFWKRKWYNFYKFQAAHDRFANVDARLTPSTGIGYWFSDMANWKAMAEVAVGIERTDFRDGTENRNELILIPRVFIEKVLWERLTFTHDTSFYPSLTEGEVRVHSETSLSTPLNDKLKLRISLVDDYNSNPAKDARKNDLRFMSSLAYSL